MGAILKDKRASLAVVPGTTAGDSAKPDSMEHIDAYRHISLVAEKLEEGRTSPQNSKWFFTWNDTHGRGERRRIIFATWDAAGHGEVQAVTMQYEQLQADLRTKVTMDYDLGLLSPSNQGRMEEIAKSTALPMRADAVGIHMSWVVRVVEKAVEEGILDRNQATEAVMKAIRLNW